MKFYLKGNKGPYIRKQYMKENFTHVAKNGTNFYDRFCKKFTSFRKSKGSLSKKMDSSE